MPTAVRKKYNFLARIYDIIYRDYLAKTMQEALLPFLLRPEIKFLDVGCGTGALEERLLPLVPNANIVAIDISEDMLAQARKKLANYPSIEWIHGDFVKTQLPENSFDVAFSLSNLHYFPNPEAVFQKIASLLKRGGIFILIDWDRNFFNARVYNGYSKKFDPSFIQVYTSQEITQLLTQTGFTLQGTKNFSVRAFWKMVRVVAKKP